jgi:fructuronate reductase
MIAPHRKAPAPPVRLVHLGLGNFFRAHQAWYTDRTPDAADWGIAAFTGRSARLAEAMTVQDCLYTLITRAADGDRFDLIGSVARAHAAADHGAWLRYLACPEVAAVTCTVTEAGYLLKAGGGLDAEHPGIQGDIAALRHDLRTPVVTAPGRLLGGLAARRALDAGPVTLVSCDNLPHNGAVVSQAIRDLARLVDPTLLEWLQTSVSCVTTMVDRITPRTTAADEQAVAERTGIDDRAPVVTEPFSEWVLSGDFIGGRPRWEDAGATFTADISPFEQRKLFLLNGGHSLLAYASAIRGATTVADAVSDATSRAWLKAWWVEASPHLALPAADVAAYCEALLERFANPRMHHRLEQIAADGSQKLPVRILPALRAERAAGRMPEGATRILAAWVLHLRGLGVPVADVHAETLGSLAAGRLPEAAQRVLRWLDPEVGADDEVVAAVVEQARELAQQ